jgi:hypothetical protein
LNSFHRRDGSDAGNDFTETEQLYRRRRDAENNFNAEDAEDAEERRVEMRKAFPRLVTA